MRRAILAASFAALVAAVGLLWAFRFEHCPALPSWNLADLKVASPEIPGIEWLGPQDNPRLKVAVSPAHPRVGARIPIPGGPAVEFLHLDFRMSARSLMPGPERWEDGRFMIEWHRAGQSDAPEMDPAGSIRYDGPAMRQRIVLHPGKGPAVPAIRLEHLGLSGSFEISDLRICAVRERLVWKIGAPLLAFAWGLWCFAWIRSWQGIPRWRAALASVVVLLMGVNFILPGPWKVVRPIGEDFRLGIEAPDPESHRSPQDSVTTHPAIASGPIPTVGKLPVQGSLALRIKLRISQARPLLHAMMFFGPTLLLGFLVGSGPAVRLAIGLALAIEAAQTAFGYGFGWDDVGDLFCNATGIFLAILVLRKLQDRLARRKPQARER
jgi:hypothetical protein